MTVRIGLKYAVSKAWALTAARRTQHATRSTISHAWVQRLPLAPTEGIRLLPDKVVKCLSQRGLKKQPGTGTRVIVAGNPHRGIAEADERDGKAIIENHLSLGAHTSGRGSTRSFSSYELDVGTSSYTKSHFTIVLQIVRQPKAADINRNH